MDANRREMIVKVAIVTVFVNICITTVACLLTPRAEWAHDLPIAIGTSTFLSIVVSVVLLRQAQASQGLIQQLKRQGSRDALTNVASRDFFFSEMESRPSAHGVLLLIDIDHFKRINDIHSYLVGDRVIREVANLLVHSIRGEDMICRFGDEEFLVFLNRQDETTGASIAERLRCAVEGRKIPVEDGKTLAVTVSVGAARMDSAKDLPDTIGATGKALYAAKKGGRNRLVVAWRDEEEASQGLSVVA